MKIQLIWILPTYLTLSLHSRHASTFLMTLMWGVKLHLKKTRMHKLDSGTFWQPLQRSGKWCPFEEKGHTTDSLDTTSITIWKKHRYDLSFLPHKWNVIMAYNWNLNDDLSPTLVYVCGRICDHKTSQVERDRQAQALQLRHPLWHQRCSTLQWHVTKYWEQCNTGEGNIRL